MPLVKLTHSQADFEAAFTALLAGKRETAVDVNAVVAAIIADVVARGDQAVIDYTARFDEQTLTPATLRLSRAEIDQAAAAVSPEAMAALELAALRIKAFHQRQLPSDSAWIDEAGVRLGLRWTAVEAAGLPATKPSRQGAA